MDYNYIKSEDILKNNKQLTFFYNYNNYKFAPANFVYLQDTNSFNRDNIIKWKNYINKKLVKLCGDVFCHYQLSNDVKITINYPNEYNKILENLLLESKANKYKYKYVFFQMMDICFQFKINMLDAFIFIFYTTNESVDNEIDQYSKIKCIISHIIFEPLKYNKNKWFNTIFDELYNVIYKQERENFQNIKNIFTNKGIKNIQWYKSKLLENDNKTNVKRAINNYISLITLKLLSNDEVKYDGKYYNAKIRTLGNNILKKLFYILNYADGSIFDEFVYILYQTAYNYFHADVNIVFLSIITESININNGLNYRIVNIKDYINGKYSDYIKEKQSQCQTNNIKKYNNNFVYYIKRDEFNGPNKRTYKLLYQFNSIDNVNTNILIMKQVSGNKFGQKYVLNKYDCEKLNIDYEPDLEVFSSELKWIKEYNNI